MSEKISRETRHYKRIFQILCELLQHPGPYKVSETAARYCVTERTIQKDLKKLIMLLNEQNGREYISRSKGWYSSNFPRATVNLHKDVFLYLFLALHHLKPLLPGNGESAFQALKKDVYTLLSGEDQKKLDTWSHFYRIGEFGLPVARQEFYNVLYKIFEAIRLNQIIKFHYQKEIRYFDPYSVYHVKNVFYVIGDRLDSPNVQGKKNRKRRFYRLDRMQEVRRMQTRSKRYKYPEDAWGFKRFETDEFLKSMLGAERYGKPRDYMIEICNEKVFKRIIEKQWHPKQTWEQIVDKSGKYRYRLRIPGVASPVEMKKFVLGWGSAVKVVKPDDFREEIEQEIKRMLKSYQDQ